MNPQIRLNLKIANISNQGNIQLILSQANADPRIAWAIHTIIGF
jgi:hypothetical protein